MKVPILAILALILASLACQIQVGNPVATATVLPTSTPVPSATAAATVTLVAETEAVQAVTIRAVVYIRREPDASSEAIGSLETGDVVEIVACVDEWCEIVDGGFVWRGCTSDPGDLKCEAKP